MSGEEPSELERAARALGPAGSGRHSDRDSSHDSGGLEEPGPGTPSTRGTEPDSSPSAFRVWRLPVLLLAVTAVTTTLAQGPAYAATLLAILGAHEMGHFVTARRLGVSASPPHFIPLPPLPAFSLGTLGAVIRMDDRGADRGQLLRIGAAGPIAGFLVAVPAMVVGLGLSEPGRIGDEQGVVFFGTSLLSAALEMGLGPALAEGEELIAHPIYIAAWAGFLVTALNLLPMGQLDGGHVVHAIAPRRSARIARGVQRVLIVLGLGGLAVVGVEMVDLELAQRLAFLRPWLSPGLLLWAALAGWLGLEHPPTAGEDQPLRRSDRWLALGCLVILIACFMPSPIYSLPSTGDVAPAPPGQPSVGADAPG